MKSLKKISMALVLFLFLIVITNFLFADRGQILKEWKLKAESDQVVADPSTFETVELPFTRVLEQPGIYEFSTTFEPDAMDYDVIHIRRLNGYAFEVNLNGQMIYQAGDMKEATANIWNYAFLIDIPDGLLHEKNVLLIRVHGLHDIGFIMEPAIGRRSDLGMVKEIQNLYGNGTSFMLIGASFMLGVFLLMVGAKRRGLLSYYLNAGFASLFFGLYIFEYTFRESSLNISAYLWIRKILIICLMLAIIFWVEGLVRILYRLQTKVYLYIIYTLSLLPILFAGDFNQLHRITNFYNATIVLSLIVLTAVMVKKPKTHMSFSVSFFAFCSIHAVIVFAFHINTIVLINYGMMALLTGLAYTMVIDIGALQEERERLGYKAIRDRLTGAFNREYLMSLRTEPGDIICFLDVDRFKQYNDSFGHQKGDELLCELVDYMNGLLLSDASVIRYGGDEFLIHMPSMEVGQAKNYMKKINGFLMDHYEFVEISYGIEVVEGDFQETIRKTDELMYAMKHNKSR